MIAGAVIVIVLLVLIYWFEPGSDKDGIGVGQPRASQLKTVALRRLRQSLNKECAA